MARTFYALSFMFLAAGCTSNQLRISTLNQASTLTDLQHQMVLNNLASVACNPNAIPFHLNLSTGSTQITDTLTPGGQVASSWFAALQGARNIVDQWETSPVTDGTTLKILRIAYRRALGSDENLYTQGLANGLAHQLKQQTAVVDDLRTLNTEIYDQSKLKYKQSREAGLRSMSKESYSECDNKPKQDCNKKKCWIEGISWSAPSSSGGLYNLISRYFVGDQIDVGAKSVKDASSLFISLNNPKIVLDGEYLTEDNLLVTPINPTTCLPISWDEIKKCDCNKYLYKIATPYAAEVRRQVKDTNDSLLEIKPGSASVAQKTFPNMLAMSDILNSVGAIAMSGFCQKVGLPLRILRSKFSIWRL